jgi:hypothetical protein
MVWIQIRILEHPGTDPDPGNYTDPYGSGSAALIVIPYLLLLSPRDVFENMGRYISPLC